MTSRRPRIAVCCNSLTRFFIAFQNLTYVQNPSYPTAESGSTAMSCVYVVNAVASAPGKLLILNCKKLYFKLLVYETEILKVAYPKDNSFLFFYLDLHFC